MKIDKKHIVKITDSDAQAEAENIILKLKQTDIDPIALSMKIINNFSGSARREIFEKMLDLLKKEWSMIPEQTLLEFFIPMVRKPARGKAAIVQKYYHSILRAAIMPYGSSSKIASEVALRTLFPLSSEENKLEIPELPTENLKNLVRSQDGMGQVIANVLRLVLERRKISLSFLDRWNTAIAPLIGVRARGGGLQGESASLILDILSNLDVSYIPDELFFACTRIAILADHDAAERFYASPAGKSIIKVLPFVKTVRVTQEEGSVSETEKAKIDTGFRLQTEAVSSAHNAFVQGLFKSITDYLRWIDNERVRLVKQCEEGDKKLKAALEKMKCEDTKMEELERNYRREINSLQSSLSKQKSKIKDLESELALEKKKKREWKQEAKLTEFGAKSSIETTLYENKDKVRQALLNPVKNLRAYVVDLLKRYRSDGDIRLFAAAFDNLLLRLMENGIVTPSDMERIPKEMYILTKSEAGQNG